MPKFSVRLVIVAVACLSIYFAALAKGTDVWRQIAVSLTLLILLAFTLQSLFRNGVKRAFAVGLAVSGWIYLLLAFAASFDFRNQLITQGATDAVYYRLHPIWPQSVPVPIQPSLTQQPQPVYPSPPPTVYPSPAYAPGVVFAAPATVPGFVDPKSFADIGHALWTLIVAVVGGLVARGLFLQSRRKAQDGST